MFTKADLEGLVNMLSDIQVSNHDSSWSLFYLKEKLLRFEQNLIARELELTPKGGWEGSNEDRRKSHKMSILSNDSTYQEFVSMKEDLEHEIRMQQVKYNNLQFELRVREAQKDLLIALGL